jgi:hypothetical protein
MKMNRRIAAATAAAAIVSVAPVGAQDQFAVTPPAGWVRTSSSIGVLGLWVTPKTSGFRQNLNLVSEPYSGSLADYVAENRAALSNQEKDLRFGPDADSRTCGDHPAHLITWEATLFGHDLYFEQMVSIWDGYGYVLTYTRESGEPELDDAREALTTLCVRPD